MRSTCSGRRPRRCRQPPASPSTSAPASSPGRRGIWPCCGCRAREELAVGLHRRRRRTGAGGSVPRHDRASRKGQATEQNGVPAYRLPRRVRHRLLRRSAALRKRGGRPRRARHRGRPRPRARRIRRGRGSRRATRRPLRRGLPLARRGGADAGRTPGWRHPARDLRRLRRHDRPCRLGHRQGRRGRGEPGQQARPGAARAQPNLLREPARVRARPHR